MFLVGCSISVKMLQKQGKRERKTERKKPFTWKEKIRDDIIQEMNRMEGGEEVQNDMCMCEERIEMRYAEFLEMVNQKNEDLKEKDAVLYEELQKRGFYTINAEEIFFNQNLSHLLFQFHGDFFSANASHNHDFIEFLYVYRGGAIIVNQEEEIHMSEGEVCLCNPRSIHRVCQENPDSILMNLVVTRESMERLSKSMWNAGDILFRFFYRCFFETEDPEPFLLFRQNEKMREAQIYLKLLFLEIDEKEKTDLQVQELLFRLFCISLTKSRMEGERKNAEKMKRNLEDMIRYMEENMTEVTLETLAKKFHYHPKYVSRLLKKETGYSFREVLNRLRLLKAETLLDESGVDMAQIAECCGFADEEVFRKVFKKNKGMTPRQYRKR